MLQIKYVYSSKGVINNHRFYLNSLYMTQHRFIVHCKILCVNTMSKHKYGLLLSQMLDSLSKPLEEEQVWALCYKISQSLLTHTGSSPLSGIRITIETIYLLKDGGVSFVCNDSQLKENVSYKHTNDLSKVLMACLENGSPNKQLKRQVGSELESLLWNLSFGEYNHGGFHWLRMVDTCCIRHTPTKLIPSIYYTSVSKSLVEEAIGMHNFLAVVMTVINQEKSKEESYLAFQLYQVLYVAVVICNESIL